MLQSQSKLLIKKRREIFWSPPFLVTFYAGVFQAQAAKLRRLLSSWMFAYEQGSSVCLCERTFCEWKIIKIKD